MHDCARRAVISSVGVEANQEVERFLNSADSPTKPQMSRPFPADEIFPRKELKENYLEAEPKHHTEKTYNQHLFSGLQETYTETERRPCLQFLLLLFNMKPSETSCYYGKRAARLTSKPTAFIFISQGMLRIQTLIHLQQITE